jgi:hypothetical protein
MEACVNRVLLTAMLLLVPSFWPVSAVAQPVPAEAKSIVAYIYVPGPKGPKDLIANGTAFFVGVKNPSKNQLAVYLVTAKHVLQAKPGEFFPRVHVRLNRKDGTSDSLPWDLETSGTKKNVFMHSNPLVDIALIPWVPDQKLYDYKVVLDGDIVSKEDVKQLNITEGPEVFFTGLFLSHAGDQRISPIVRFGRIALMTDELIEWSDEGRLSLYVVESASYGGNSGSPVLLFLGPERVPGVGLVAGPRLIKLAGVMKGAFGELSPIKMINAASIPVARANIGVAAVVPAYQLREILFGTELKKQRGF